MQWWVLKKRLHSSWLIAMLSFGVVVGSIGAQYVPAGWLNSVGWLCAGIALAVLGFWRRRVYALLFLLVAGGIIGLWRGSGSLQELQPYERLIGHTVTVAGTVTEDPELDKNGQLVLRVGSVKINEHELAGNIWISAASKHDIKRGDIVAVSGKLAEGFGSFAASMYYADIVKVQRPMPGDVAGRIRDNFADKVRAAIPEPQASLGLGYLVGQRNALPAELDNALKVAGLTHVIVASGYNLTILVRLARRLFAKISKYLAALSAGTMIVAFILVTGMSPSMSRAGLVAGLSLLAWYYGRKFHPLVLLPFAAAVTLLINPSYGWNDLGWELSFAAFAGVMIIAPLGQRYFFGDKQPGTVRQILGETISAQLATLPILVMAFGQFSNVALFANLLILPLVPLAMLLTFIAGIGALVVPSLAMIIGQPAYWLLSYMTGTAQYFAGLPWAQTKLTVGPLVFALCYVALILGCLYMWWRTRLNLRDTSIVE